MARSQTMKDIRAKPNAKGKTSHIPERCNATKTCTNDALINRGIHSKRERICESHYENPPQKVTPALKRLKQMGLV